MKFNGKIYDEIYHPSDEQNEAQVEGHVRTPEKPSNKPAEPKEPEEPKDLEEPEELNEPEEPEEPEEIEEPDDE